MSVLKNKLTKKGKNIFTKQKKCDILKKVNLEKEVYKEFLVIITWRKYLFPYRTQKSSSNVPKILVGFPAEKIGCRQVINSSLAQLVERSAVEQVARLKC